jgi:hypothetical protein
MNPRPPRFVRPRPTQAPNLKQTHHQRSHPPLQHPLVHVMLSDFLASRNTLHDNLPDQRRTSPPRPRTAPPPDTKPRAGRDRDRGQRSCRSADDASGSSMMCLGAGDTGDTALAASPTAPVAAQARSPCTRTRGTRTRPGSVRRHPRRAAAQPRRAPALAQPATAHAPGPRRVPPPMTCDRMKYGTAEGSARQVRRYLRRAALPAHARSHRRRATNGKKS